MSQIIVVTEDGPMLVDRTTKAMRPMRRSSHRCTDCKLPLIAGPFGELIHDATLHEVFQFSFASHVDPRHPARAWRQNG